MECLFSFSLNFRNFEVLIVNAMRTLRVSISDNEYQMYGIKNDHFSDIVRMVNRNSARQKLAKSLQIAKECGLSEMTMDEISGEVNAVRKDAKARY
jgi:hypothetical protein